MLFAQQQRNRIMPYTKIASGATPSDCAIPLPGDFDSERFPILAAHWFGIVPHALDPRVIRILGADRFPTTPVHEVCR